MKRLGIALSFGLFILWAVNLNAPNTNGLHWFDFIGAVVALTLVTTLKSRKESALVGGLLGLAAGLMLVWVAGLASQTAPSLTWANFIFAGAFLALGLFAVSDRPFFAVRERKAMEPGRPVGAAGPYGEEEHRRMEAAAATVTTAPRTAGVSLRPDGIIEEEIEQRLLDRWDLDSRRIRVRVREGVAILNGTVTSATEKRIAEFATESVRGVVEVRNALEIIETPKEGPERDIPPRAA